MRARLIYLVAMMASAPCHAAGTFTVTAAELPGPAVALLWLAALGWTFLWLLRRLLRGVDRRADIDVALAGERVARVAAERALSDTHLALARLLAQRDSATDSAREGERQRIARDIHDDLGQNLLALKLDLQLLRAKAAPREAIHLARVESNLEVTIRSLRAIINDLRPAALEAGLQTAMEWHLQEFSRTSGIACRLVADDAAFAACPALALDALLYRVLQESLTNVARHAQATEVRIALGHDAAQLTFEVHDNGVGMRAGRAPGCGLHGMRARVAAIGGRLAITSAPGAGTLLSLAIPLTQPLGEIGKCTLPA
jgi:signal transduction histidine kinase